MLEIAQAICEVLNPRQIFPLYYPQNMWFFEGRNALFFFYDDKVKACPLSDAIIDELTAFKRYYTIYPPDESSKTLTCGMLIGAMDRCQERIFYLSDPDSLHMMSIYDETASRDTHRER
jgi:hypothetical protein